jgi:hypothetical protein
MSEANVAVPAVFEIVKLVGVLAMERDWLFPPVNTKPAEPAVWVVVMTWLMACMVPLLMWIWPSARLEMVNVPLAVSIAPLKLKDRDVASLESIRMLLRVNVPLITGLLLEGTNTTVEVFTAVLIVPEV